MALLFKVTENDKRFFFALLIVLILLFALIGFIGSVIVRVMKWQGKKLDEITYDVVRTRVIDSEKKFFIYANKKNWRLFFLQAWKPLLIITVAVLFLVIRNAICNDWGYNVWDHEKTGFGTLLFIWDFSGMITTNPDGFSIHAAKLVSTPHWSNEAWASYIFVPLILVGGTWYLVSVQCAISRLIRTYQVAKNVYSKNLDGYNQNDATIKDKEKYIEDANKPSN